ncbi:MAG: hypothetical protein MK101_10045 [Phycisphaerales bacterium]|nr:hypothetical protein [Phycisphaerales bacterium]
MTSAGLLKRFLLFVAAISIGSAIASLSGGCNIAAAVDAVTRPDPVVEAKHTLPDVATVVFIDDRRNQINPVRVRRQIADEITAVLIEEGSMTDMISARDAVAAARRLDSAGSVAGINQIGEAVGADQVIYVEALGFQLTRNGLSPDPMAAFNVRVLDVRSGERTFPETEQFQAATGHPVQVTIPRKDWGQFTGSGGLSKLRTYLAKESGDTIARLFVTTHYTQAGEKMKPL